MSNKKIGSNPTVAPKATLTSKVQSININQQVPIPLIDNTTVEIRHSLYGLQAYVSGATDDLSNLDKQGFNYDLQQYKMKWFVINNTSQEAFDDIMQRNCIYSFIRALLREPVGGTRYLNTDSFRTLTNPDGSFYEDFNTTNSVATLIETILESKVFTDDVEDFA